MSEKTARALRRSATIVQRDAAGGARRATFRLVTPEIARDGIVLLPEGIDLAAHKAAGSPFIWGHDTTDPDNAIGRIVEYRQSPAALDVVVEFADDGEDGLATRCWRKVDAGLINSVSVNAAILASETRQIGGRTVEVATRSEMQEASLVIVGADRGAVRIDRAAVLRALDNLDKEPSRMDKQALCKLLSIEETADRETVEAALVKYLTETTDAPEARKAAAAAVDEHFPEAPAPTERAADATQTEVEELREANRVLREALDAAKAGETDAKADAERAAKREAQITKDVDGWISEGRVKRAERDQWLTKHREGKAAGILRHIPAGAFTSGQRLAGGAVGTPVEMPAAPVSEVRSVARGLVQQARSLDRSDQPSGATAVQHSETKADAKSLITDALSLGRGAK